VDFINDIYITNGEKVKSTLLNEGLVYSTIFDNVSDTSVSICDDEQFINIDTSNIDDLQKMMDLETDEDWRFYINQTIEFLKDKPKNADETDIIGIKKGGCLISYLRVSSNYYSQYNMNIKNIGFPYTVKSERKKGYASRLLQYYMNNPANIGTLFVYYIPKKDNIASRNLAEKCGFKFEGIRKHYLFEVEE